MLFQRKGERVSGCVNVSLHNFHSLAELFFSGRETEAFYWHISGGFSALLSASECAIWTNEATIRINLKPARSIMDEEVKTRGEEKMKNNF